MAKLSIVAGATSVSVNVFIQNSSSTTGAGLTGLVYNSSGLVAYYTFAGANAANTAISLATLAAVNSAFSSGGFKEISSANMPGLYRLDIPNAALAAGNGRSVTIMLSGAANQAPTLLEIELTGPDNQDAVHFGLSAIPNATAGASNGLLISGSNAGTTTFGALTVTGTTTHTGATVCTGNVSMAAGLTITQSVTNGAGVSITGNGTGQGIISTGGATGPGAKFVGGGTSGDGIDITTTSGDGLSITPTAGNAITATANGTSKHGFVITGGTAGTSDGVKCVAGTGGVDLRANQTGNITGNLTGSAGSVTATVTANTTQIGGQTAAASGTVNFTTYVGAGIKKNQTPPVVPFLMRLSVDHVTPATGKTVTVQRSIDGGAFANASNATATEISNGWYYWTGAAADVNGAAIAVRASATGCDDTPVGLFTTA